LRLYGRHVFELAELDRGRTRLDNVETFSGKTAARLLEQHQGAVRSEFVAFDEALRAAAEMRRCRCRGGNSRRPSRRLPAFALLSN